MKLVALNVDIKEGEEPAQKLDEGEHIVKKVVELDKLLEELEGEWQHVCRDLTITNTNPALLFASLRTARYVCIPMWHRAPLTDVTAGFVIDARLHHFAAGWSMARHVTA